MVSTLEGRDEGQRHLDVAIKIPTFDADKDMR